MVICWSSFKTYVKSSNYLLQAFLGVERSTLRCWRLFSFLVGSPPFQLQDSEVMLWVYLLQHKPTSQIHTSTWARGVVQQKEPQAIRQDRRSGSPSASVDSLNSGKLLFVFSLLLGQLKTRPPFLLIPKVKMNCNNTIQSALKTVECLVIAIGWNCQISQGKQSPQVCLGPWTPRSAKLGNWSVPSFFLPAFLS